LGGKLWCGNVDHLPERAAMSRMIVNDTEIQNAEIFEIILENFPDIIHSINENGDIIFTNRAAENLLGYSRGELLSMNIRQLYAPEILEAVEAGFTDLKTKGDKRVESVLATKSGERIPVEIRSFSIYDDEDNFLRTFSILRDIRKVKELEDNLIHAGRLAAIGELASGVAHDINNPLTIVLLSNDLLMHSLEALKGAPPEQVERVAHYAADVQKATESIQKLADHLRNFSRGTAEEHEILDIADVINDALFLTTSKVKRSQVNVASDVSKGKHHIVGSPNRMEQVFVNLIANACDALTNQNQATLTIDVIPTTHDGIDHWQCRIADNGPGIPKEHLADVFTSFFTTKPRGEGTGLGLSISRGIARDHKGDITVETSHETGTTFFVTLPQYNR
jgi:PAS domain S-box-containing protein